MFNRMMFYLNQQIFTGTVTTSVTIYSLLAILVTNLDIQARLQSEIDQVIGQRQPQLKGMFYNVISKKLLYVASALLESSE